MKTYKQFNNKSRNEENLEEGNKTRAALKIFAISMTNKLAVQSRKVLSAKTTNQKLDELARAISISGGISAIAVAVSDGGKSGLSKIISVSTLTK